MNAKRLLLGGALISLLLTAVQPTQAQGLTFSTNTYAVGTSPDSVAVADVNDDGYPDLISANATANTLTVLTNNGSGIFGFNATLPVGTDPIIVAAADINGDGKPDLISANSSANTLTILTNNGYGVFGLNATLNTYGTPVCLALADIYGNGRLDLICANNDGSLIVFTNTGPGGFVPNSSIGGVDGLAWVVAADVNGDGHPDLITANSTANTLSVLTNSGTGNFTLAATLNLGTNSDCSSVAAADVNGDGRVDLVSINGTANSFTVLTNRGFGQFGSNTTVNLTGEPTSLVLADLNGDGKADLAMTVSALISTIQVFTNNGSGRFGSNTTVNLSAQKAIVAADVNNSILNGLITAGASASKLTVLASTGLIRPALKITRPTTNSFIISWVSPSTNFILQTNNNLATTNWFPGKFPVTTTITGGATNQSSTLTSPPRGNLFFRLIN